MWQKLTTLENLFNAYRAAARGKRKKPDVANFEFNLEENIFNLREELMGGSYRHGPYHSFYIHDPSSFHCEPPSEGRGCGNLVDPWGLLTSE